MGFGLMNTNLEEVPRNDVLQLDFSFRFAPTWKLLSHYICGIFSSTITQYVTRETHGITINVGNYIILIVFV